MSTPDELLEKQALVMRSIARSIPNFKKLGVAKITVAVTKNRINLVKESFLQAQELHAQLSAKADAKTKAAHPYFVGSQFDACEDSYQETLDYLQEVLEQLVPTSKTGPDAPTMMSLPWTRAAWQLPPIQLPSFDGNFDLWESFRDQFTSLVINDKALTKVDKMHYLFSALKGEASQAITHLQVTDANFDVAWETISVRYSNTRRLIMRHLQTLMAMPPAMSETAKELRGLHDRMHGAIEALRNLGRSVNHWDDILVFVGTQGLDKATRKAWELKLGNSRDFPTFKTFSEFLEARIYALESLAPVKADPHAAVLSKPSKIKSVNTHTTLTSRSSCPICKGDHLIYKCPTFLAQLPSERYSFIKRQRRCINCFSVKHTGTQCTNPHTCRECKQRHHTLLHFPSRLRPEETPLAATPPTDNVCDAEIASHLVAPPNSHSILLSTARVRVYSENGRWVCARALIDPGSVATLITEDLAQRLRLRRQHRAICVSGVGDSKSMARHVAVVRITPEDRMEPAYTTSAVILKSLTKYTPLNHMHPSNWAHISGLQLADRNPMNSDPIDILLGADLYHEFLREGVRRGTQDEPIAQQTVFGWILSGPITSSPGPSDLPIHHCMTLEDLDETLRKFWELEEVPSTSNRSTDDERCEDHFKRTHTRDTNGRYVVRLPFKADRVELGDSRCVAGKVLSRLEARFLRDPDLALSYREFLIDYETLGHMTRVESLSRERNTPSYFIPHHAVVKENSSTTRLRVVFNASASSSNGNSLNDVMFSGPKLQTDLLGILLRWRQYQLVYTADIAKMFRQIQVDPRDRDFQRILWRKTQFEPVSEYHLNTVTYGTTAAPYLAIRVLHQLALDEGAAFPLALPVIRHQTYVDDCLFGADDMSRLRQTRDQLIALLKRGGFRLRKWASNHAMLLTDIEPTDHGLALEPDSRENQFLSVLGLTWDSNRDNLRYQMSITRPANVTKRTILSIAARMFDPLGWIAPVVITAKIVLQQLWFIKCGWDDSVPEAIQNSWLEYLDQLHLLQELTQPRRVSPYPAIRRELHGFADASTKAYAAVIFQRCTMEDGSVSVSLLVAKTRVAPLKTISLPRLELCAALLLAKLMSYVTSAIDHCSFEQNCWTDSSIALAWINQSPARWKTFVANRVSKIQSSLPDARWRHVPSPENPADCASRGLLPSQLYNHSLWWSGPPWLRESLDSWPKPFRVEPTETVEEERKSVPVHTSAPILPWDIATRYSTWTKLIRVTAFIMRFIRNLQSRGNKHRDSTHLTSQVIQSKTLTSEEVQQGKLFWLRQMQAETFPDELSRLHNSESISKSSSLSALGPYLGEDGLVRASGRLRHAELPITAKKPVILGSHPLLTLIIRDTHLRHLHSGPQLTLALLRQEYWILRARAKIRAVLHQCVACTRERGSVPQEFMGDLPAARVTMVDRPFTNTGVDYAGPILVRARSGRGQKAHKAYISVFICMATKAVHIELVNDYSSAAFIAAFCRFSARRGLPQSMYSDNGTTFQGANRELREWYREVTNSREFADRLTMDGVKWHFLPPSAPHFGGLWEAAVKSVKYHLRRCIGAHTLTQEEMITLLCRIEACLNSRPIAPMSDSIEDYEVLTPAHFLIGTTLSTPAEPSVINLKENRLSRWQLVQRLTESFWRSWKTSYLHTLQQRPKWRTVQALARVGQIVLIRNPHSPPCKWELGRITNCHAGKDGLVRVVTVKTATSTFTRPIVQLCFLPVQINDAISPVDQ